MSGVTDAQLHAYYDGHHAEFDRPGSAGLSLVVIPRVITAADSEAVRAHALALRQEIVSGKTSFADVAKRESVDSVSAANGGALGMSAKGRFVPAFEKAEWALKPGEVSQPVLTPFGYHLIEVDGRKGDSLSVRHILLRIQPSDTESAHMDALADTLTNLAGSAEVPAKLDSAAAKLHLTIYRISATENQSAVWNGKQVPSASAWAFGGARKGDVSDLFDDENGYYMVRLDSLVPAGLGSFDQVKDQVRADVAAAHHLDRMMAPARAFAAAAATEGLEATAKKMGLDAQRTAIAFTRTSFVPGLGGQFTAAIGAAFGLPVNAVGEPIRDETQLTVERVDRRVPADSAAWLKQKDQQKQQRLQQLQQARLQMFLQDLHDQAKIVDRRKAIDAAARHSSS